MNIASRTVLSEGVLVHFYSSYVLNKHSMQYPEANVLIIGTFFAMKTVYIVQTKIQLDRKSGFDLKGSVLPSVITK